MTQNEVLAMLHKVVAENQQYTTWTVSTPHLVALVNQAVALEREACAKLVEGSGEEMSDKNWDSEYEAFAEYAARTIRARGERQ